jgi:hypothetical protein
MIGRFASTCASHLHRHIAGHEHRDLSRFRLASGHPGAVACAVVLGLRAARAFESDFCIEIRPLAR